MAARLFGTDGVRGLANKYLTAELALDLSVAAAHVLGEVGAFKGHRPLRRSQDWHPPGWMSLTQECCQLRPSRS
jgi:hypothetical protein